RLSNTSALSGPGDFTQEVEACKVLVSAMDIPPVILIRALRDLAIRTVKGEDALLDPVILPREAVLKLPRNLKGGDLLAGRLPEECAPHTAPLLACLALSLSLSLHTEESGDPREQMSGHSEYCHTQGYREEVLMELGALLVLSGGKNNIQTVIPWLEGMSVLIRRQPMPVATEEADAADPLSPHAAEYTEGLRLLTVARPLVEVK
ncbi:hypothetical protein KIPB_000306, partial [Kipferlia bialata]